MLIGDAWFGSARAAAATVERNIEVVHQSKTNHSLFPKQCIEEALKDAPGGCHVALEG